MNSSALQPVSEEMREWCSILEKEMMRWPGVKVSHLFGTLAFHHRKTTFATLPDKRNVDGFDFVQGARQWTDRSRHRLADFQTHEA